MIIFSTQAPIYNEIPNLNLKINELIENCKLKIGNFCRRRSGFTLIELLIVIAVIGGLAAISVASFPAAGKRARDATRKNDMKQFQTAMETYNNKTGVYPVTSGTPSAGGVCGASALNLPACPRDPKSGWNYTLNSTTATYVVYSQLEQPTNPAATYFVVCADGRSGECASPGAATACLAACP